MSRCDGVEMGGKKKNSDKVILVRGAETALKRTLFKLALNVQKQRKRHLEMLFYPRVTSTLIPIRRKGTSVGRK